MNPPGRISRFATRPLIFLIRGYQKVISPLFPPQCKYYPVCSRYAIIALSRHGVITGTRLALWRIVRCNPWSAGGIDEVPN